MLSSHRGRLNAIPLGDFRPSLGSPISSLFPEKCSSLPLLSPLRTGGGPSSSTSSPSPPPPPPSDAPDLKLDYFHQFPVPLKQPPPRCALVRGGIRPMGVGGVRLGNGGEAKKGKGAIQYIRLSPDPQLPQHSAWQTVWKHAESPSLDRQRRQRGRRKGF